MQRSELSSLPSRQLGMPSHRLKLPSMQPTPEGQVTCVQGRRQAQGSNTVVMVASYTNIATPLGTMENGRNTNPNIAARGETSGSASSGHTFEAISRCNECPVWIRPDALPLCYSSKRLVLAAPTKSHVHFDEQLKELQKSADSSEPSAQSFCPLHS